ncbi:CpaE-like family protein [Actinomadura barringtoniae]|uniref:CpaE-like family protein n=1 Tax=Actinomadura barringtoniae TaxID=1427535 RepID=A0A939TDF3_9ACTN|nr:septum site-determining protein Ssd [Actinomadura barringtoniae]MBO2455527.1 CpaE-like family protein [Actinomadura barringtoniae]
MASAAMIVTADPTIQDDLLRLAAAANAQAEVAHHPDQARPSWHSPPLVLVGTDLADEVAAAEPQRRAGVVLVSRESETENIYRQAVEIGAQDLALLPRDEAWLIDALASAAEPVDGFGTMICVTGARGGSGTSVFAAGLALTAARQGLRTLLVDGDPLGGGLDLVLGLEEYDGARWPDFAERQGRLSAATLRQALPRLGDLSVLSWSREDPVPVAPEAILSLLDAAVRGFALVVVDVPSHLGDIGRTALRASDLTLLLVPAEVRAAVAANLQAAALRRETSELRLIVRGPSPGGLTPKVIAESLALPPSGTFERDRRLPAALEQGDFPRAARRGSLTDLCSALVEELDLHTYEPRMEAA